MKNMSAYLSRYLFVVVAFILSATSLFALELKSDELNYIIAIPGTWTVKSQDQTGFYVESEDGKRAVSLAILYPCSAKIDSSYVTRIEQVQPKRDNFQMISNRLYEIDGVAAYENVQRLGKASFASVNVELEIIAERRFYHLSLISYGGDAAQDPEMQEVLASFHFLHPPKFLASSIVGRFSSFGVKLAIPGVIIVGIAFMVIRSRRL
jgi:hypothetical protein